MTLANQLALKLQAGGSGEGETDAFVQELRTIYQADIVGAFPDIVDGSQSLPRELSLADDGSLRIKPLRELNRLRHDPRVFQDFTVAPEKRTAGGSARKRILDLDGDA